MNSLTRFFSKPANWKKMVPIVDGKSDISLRLVDWFVTNYSKTNNTVLLRQRSDGMGTEPINVYINYRSQLRAFSKHLFDPFRRQEKFDFVYDKTNQQAIQTTIGQLNFFRWAIENDILDYIERNRERILSDMNQEETIAVSDSAVRKNLSASVSRPSSPAKKKATPGGGSQATPSQTKKKTAVSSPRASASSSMIKKSLSASRVGERKSRTVVKTADSLHNMSMIQSQCVINFE